AQLTAPEWKAQLKKAPDRAPSVVFLFAGGGAQHPGMARGLYEHEPAFRVAADECFAAMPPATRDTLRGLLFGEQTGPRHGPAMECPSLLLPALFLVEYALARTFASFGIVPAAMLGHSVGEYVAATLGGTWSLDQVLPALVLRGECLEQAPPGAVLSVSLPAAEVLALGDPELSLSAANAPELSAVAGSPAAIERLERTLQARGVQFQRLRIGVGAHSHLLEPVLDRFRQGLRRFRLQPASTPWVSNVTGEFLDPQRAADPEYWVEHVRRTVRFQDGVAALLAGGDRVFVEIGPGKALTSLVRMHERAAKSATLVSMPHPQDEQPADAVALAAIGRLWQLGVAVDWQAFHGGVARRRVPLPTYAFQRQRHWIEPGTLLTQEGVVQARDEAPTRLPESEWLRVPVFRRQQLAAGVAAPGKANWLVVGNDVVAGILARLVREQGGQAVVVQAGPVEQRTDSGFGLPVHDVAAWERALQELVATGRTPTRILFALPLEQHDAGELVRALLAMWQALGRCELTRDLRALGVTRLACRVASEGVQRPGQGAVAGFLRVVPREFPGVRTRCVDLDDATSATDVARALLREADADDQPLQVAIRAGARFVQELVAAEPGTPHDNGAHPWRRGASWLISGGLGGIGLAVAHHLATTTAAKLVLLGRRGLPPRELWDEWLAVRAGDRQAGLIRNVRELERAGAQVEVVAADVADPAAMAGVVRGATARFGKLFGIVHAAGVLDDGPLMTRQQEQCDRMLAPKVGGAMALDAATAAAPPAVFAVFASTSGLHAIPGQCDYAAANTALDTFAAWRAGERPGRTLALDWGVWQDAGMLATRATTAVPAPAWLGHRADRDGAAEFTGAWSPSTHWQLAEHRIRGGDCVMPGTGLIEAMAAAAQAVAGSEQVALQRIEFVTPLAFPGEQPRTVVVMLRASGDGHEVVVASSAPGQSAAHDRTTHARAFASSHADDGPRFDVASLRAALRTPAPVRGDQDRLVAFGPRWQCITAVVAGDGQVLADLRLPAAFTADLADHRAHAALLDMAFGCGIRLLGGGNDALFVPAGCEQVVVYGRVPEAVSSHVRVRSHDEHSRLAVLDVTVATPSGIVVLELRGLQLFGVKGRFGSAAAAARPGVAAPARPVAGASAGAAVPRIRAILPRGITAAEGLRGLEQALQTNSNQVVVSAMDPARVAAWLSLPPERPRASTSSTAAEPAA
ncbi:MAG: SDR family NAD(P)-dependent oxidoreductase, partial [Planctomycetota bacterium]